MPPAGTLLCRYCGIYRRPDQMCPQSIEAGEPRCRADTYGCCKNHIYGTCHFCEHLKGIRCGEIGPMEPLCGYCNSHRKCCTWTCACCLIECCTQDRGKPYECSPGEKYCRQCHQRKKPNCKHCQRCIAKKDSYTRCCGYCSVCCDNVGCDKRIKTTIFQMPMVGMSVCTRCIVKVFGNKCHICGNQPKKPRADTEITCPAPNLSLPYQFRTNKSARLCGLEIEVSRYKDGSFCDDVIRKWGGAMGTDGSVPSGFEARTPPTNGDKLIQMLTDISTEFKRGGCTAGKDAGLHVHVDASDFYYNDIRKLLAIYSKIEAAMYSIVDMRRVGGTYCKMYGPGLFKQIDDPATCKSDILTLVKGEGDSTFKKVTGKGIGDRYMGLNLAPWWSIGTIEFRMHHGTTQADKLINWALLCIGLLDSAHRATDREANNWPEGPRGLLKIAPSQDVKWWVALRYQYFKEKRNG